VDVTQAWKELLDDPSAPATQEDVRRLEAKLDALLDNQARLEKALKAHGVGAWQENGP
jgi:hypothetical protein